MIGDRNGWGEIGPRESWTCPECGQASDPDLWPEREPYCEDCGSHDGRACPHCDGVFDHVWDSERIEEASA